MQLPGAVPLPPFGPAPRRNRSGYLPSAHVVARSRLRLRAVQDGGKAAFVAQMKATFAERLRWMRAEDREENVRFFAELFEQDQRERRQRRG